MTGPAAGEPDRGEGAPRRSRDRDTSGSILWILAFGLFLRAIIAYLLPGSGFEVDLNAFRFWANDLADNGLHGFYERGFFADYTPGYLYVLWLVGAVGNLVAGPAGPGDLIKVPPILADLALGWLVWSMTLELGGSRRAARLGALLVVLNPITWFDSVAWGQVDSVGVVVLLFALRELWRDRPERSAVLTVVAALIKPQLAILVPLVAAVTIRRALWPDGAHGADPAPTVGRTTSSWERRTRGPLRILTTGAAGLLTAIALALPYGLSLPGLVSQIFKTAGGYPYLSVNAYNPWALVTLDGRGIAASRAWLCDVALGPTGDSFQLGPLSIPAGDAYRGCSEGLMFGPFPAVLVGALLLLSAFVVVSLVVARRPDRSTMLVGLAVLALAFFVLPTRVHERYLYPLVAIGAILAAASGRWRIAYVVSSGATFANMYAVLTTLYPGNPGISDWLGIGDALTSWPGVALAATCQAAVLGWAVLQLRPSAAASLLGEIGARTRPQDGVVATAEPASETPPSLGAAGRATVPAPPPVSAPARALWRDRPALGELGLRRWLRARIAERPIRPDRSRALAGESGGRLDRLDAWVLAFFVVGLLTLRVWRLPEPYQMHFDEVYHARTATEFLQEWRYGISHNIYEWTHPHLAKYAMAGGIVAWGEDDTRATSDLGVSVRAAAIEPRWDDGPGPDRPAGGRLWIVTGNELRAYDLATRTLVARVAVPGADAVAVDRVGHRVLVGTAAGAVLAGSSQGLDGSAGGGLGLEPVSHVEGGPIVRLHATADGLSLIAVLPGDVVVSLDAGDGAETGRTTVPGLEQLADAGTGPAVIARPDAVTDPGAAATILARLMVRSAGELEERLRADQPEVILGAVPVGDTRTELDAAIADGRLVGIEVGTVTRLAIAGREGVTFLAPSSGQVVTIVGVGGPARGLAGTVGLDHDRLYVSYDAVDGPRIAKIAIGGESAANGPAYEGQFRLPGAGSRVFFDVATQLVHVLGEAPTDAPGSSASSPATTVYVIEPHGDAVFADAPLAIGPPTAIVLDDDQRYPSSDRQELIALAADGRVATIETGRHAFAWRLPGVLAGVLMGALIYVLARLLFRRRSVALIAAFLVLVDGMLFAHSRIGMNDPYVGLFVVAAYTLFAAIFVRQRERLRGWFAFALAMPAIGILLGLALAAKWVAAYAIAGLGVLVLTRSALGRVILIGGLIAATTVLGYVAVSVPAGQSGGNLLFMLIMIALTVAAVVVNVVHPIAWSAAERRTAVWAPAALGAAIVLAALAAGGFDPRRVLDPETRIVVGGIGVAPAEIGLLLLGAAAAIQAALILAGRWGFGPLAPARDPDDPAALLEPAAPPPRGWLDLGSGLGLPAAWTLVCLVAVPVAVYVASYVPWAFVEDHVLLPGWPAGHAGQSLTELTSSMYRYHNELSSGHAASSPWWAWPFDFKPVWFYQESFAGGTAAAIYDAGNLVAWWLGIPAMALASWWAFKRRSAALGLVVIAFAFQWLAWSRIDRAAFQYHYYTSLPFLFLALGYFLAELWHGASRRAWLVARLAAAAAVLAPTTLWLLHRPLCLVVGVLEANPGSRACPTLIPEAVLTYRTAAISVVVGIGVLIMLRLLLTLGRDDAEAEDGPSPPAVALARRLGPVLLAATGITLAFIVARAFFPEAPLLQVTEVPVEPIALLATIALLPLAVYLAAARDARRFVAGAIVAIGGWFVLWYPNLSALPLPAPMSNTFQGLLPTYVYPFQFPVSQVDRSGPGPDLLAPGPLILLGALTVTCVVVGYSAWVWRVALAERAAERAGRPGYALNEDGRGEAGTPAR